jgi:hypothetical protein
MSEFRKMIPEGAFQGEFEIKPGELIITGFAKMGVDYYVRLGIAVENIKTGITYILDPTDGELDVHELLVQTDNDEKYLNLLGYKYQGEFPGAPVTYEGIFEVFFSEEIQKQNQGAPYDPAEVGTKLPPDLCSELKGRGHSVIGLKGVIGINHKGIHFDKPRELFLYMPIRITDCFKTT